jgi:hypothetical protein
MSSDITVRDLASMALDEDAMCQIWTPLYGTIFDGSFNEAKNCPYINSTVDSFQVEDSVFVMNI